jgi:hypothetical protein
MIRQIKNIGLMAVAFMSGNLLVGCGDDYPTAVETPYFTDLLTIKIVNAGTNGNQTVEGIVDEETKSIKFPRLDLGTDFSAIRVEATVSEGATLQDTVYDFSMDEEDTHKTLLLRVTNHNRYKDYFMDVRKRIPVYGADYDNATVADYSTNSGNMYIDYNGLTVRGGDFDGKYILVVSRATTGLGPHLLRVSDLMAGKTDPIKLSTTEMTGGTFAYNMGALVNGHIYVTNLSGGKASPLKVYYYDTPESEPECIANINVADINGAGTRHGDNMSLNLDADGNGYLYFGDNGSTEVTRFTVTNGKTISDAKVLPSDANVTAFMTINKVADSNDYLWTGVRTGLWLADEELNVKYKLNRDLLPIEAEGARVFTFNQTRYLLVCPAGLGGASTALPGIYLFDISKGNTVQEALEKFAESTDHNAVYTQYLGGSGNSAPATGTNYYIEKDADGNDAYLYLYATRAGSGFTIVKLPAKKEIDD